jgi:glucose-6-phosphate 1-epimerase
MTSQSNPNQPPVHETAHDIVRIESGGVAAEVNPQGAFIEKFGLTDQYGSFRDILFPYNAAAEKPRGTHLCLPNFGPDATGNLDQHGFARTVAWEVLGSSDSELKMQYKHTEGDYSGLTAELHLRVQSNEQSEDAYGAVNRKPNAGTLVLDLMLLNEGQHTMRVAPAVHNYFALPEGMSPEEILVEGKSYSRQSLEDSTTELWPTDNDGLLQPVKIELPEHSITMHSNNFNHYTTWTNFAGPYICVEPSAAGPSFLNEQGGPDEYLEVNKTKLFRMAVEAGLG